MKLLVIFALVIVYAATAESRYPYEDTYTPGDIVPGLNSRYPYRRESGYSRRYGKPREDVGVLPKKNGYGRHRDDALLNRDYRRSRKDYDSYLPPRGIGDYNRRYERPGYDYGRRRYPIGGPPRYYDEDEIDYGGYKKSNIGRTRYN